MTNQTSDGFWRKNLSFFPVAERRKLRAKVRTPGCHNLLFSVAKSCLTLWDPMNARLLCSTPGSFVLQYLNVQSCPTLCNPMDYSLPGSLVHGIFQASILEWVAISFFRGSSQPRDWTQVSRIVGRCFTICRFWFPLSLSGAGESVFLTSSQVLLLVWTTLWVENLSLLARNLWAFHYTNRWNEEPRKKHGRRVMEPRF